MNDFRFIDCINDDKPATGLVFVATEPSFDEVHYCRAKTLFGKFNIRPQATDQNSGIAAKILLAILSDIFFALSSGASCLIRIESFDIVNAATMLSGRSLRRKT